MKIKWTEYEDNILRQHYPGGGSAACMKLLDLRTKYAITQRACGLGIKSGMDLINREKIRDTYFTKQQIQECRLMREWRGPVNKGVLRWAV